MKIFSEELVEKAVKELHIANLAQATIGDVLLVAQYLEKETGIPFIRMDQGSPGLAANQIGIEAEKAALDRGVGSQYPAAAGVPELKKEASRFVKAFLNLDISPRACVPTTGSVAGSFGSFIACTQRIPELREQLSKDFQPKEPTEYLTRSEVCKILQIDLSTLHRWRKEGVLTAYQMGNRIYFKRSEIDDYINKNRLT
jgi:excisionase family DNA binding protein